MPEPWTSQKLEGYKESTVIGDMLVYVVVLLSFDKILFFFSVMYDSKFETKENEFTCKAKDQIEQQHLYSVH